ncbi:MAG: hypothetical protein H3C27_15455 [Opitutaceae bacterium]|nr:hypothetical protein [Opitutaceae bacterium]
MHDRFDTLPLDAQQAVVTRLNAVTSELQAVERILHGGQADGHPQSNGAMVHNPTTELEYAVHRATGLIELMTSKLAHEERAGALTHKPAKWVSDIIDLATDVSARLESTFLAHCRAGDAS